MNLIAERWLLRLSHKTSIGTLLSSIKPRALALALSSPVMPYDATIRWKTQRQHQQSFWRRLPRLHLQLDPRATSTKGDQDFSCPSFSSPNGKILCPCLILNLPPLTVALRLPLLVMIDFLRQQARQARHSARGPDGSCVGIHWTLFGWHCVLLEIGRSSGCP